MNKITSKPCNVFNSVLASISCRQNHFIMDQNGIYIQQLVGQNVVLEVTIFWDAVNCTIRILEARELFGVGVNIPNHLIQVDVGDINAGIDNVEDNIMGDGVGHDIGNGGDVVMGEVGEDGVGLGNGEA